MTDTDLDALEALAEAATPGPWTTLGFSVRDTVGSRVAETTFVSGPEDAPFIAAARTAVPALVARVRELQALRASSVADLHHDWAADKADYTNRYEIAHESFMLSQRECDSLRARLEEAERERDLLAQTMWDGWATLGFDTDGDSGPGAWIAGAKSYAIWAEGWLRDIREHRKDDDEGMDEEIALRDQISQLADEWAGRSMRIVCDDAAKELAALIHSDTGGTE